MGFDLPPGWITASFADVSSYVQRGKSPKYSDKTTCPIINQKCIRWHGIECQHLKFIQKSQWEGLSGERFLQEGDLLWNSTGTGTIGRACLFRTAYVTKAVVDSHVTIVRLSKGMMSPEYVFYYVMSPYIQKEIENMQAGSTNQVELGLSVILSKVIPIAPLNEQKRIVDKIERLFSNLDEGEALLKQVQKQLATYRQSVLKAAVTGDLTKDWREANKDHLESGEALLQRILKSRRENWQGRGKYQEPVAPDTSNLPKLPVGWVWVSPDQVSLMFGNGLSKKPANYETKYPILRISAVRPMSVNTSDIRFYQPTDNEKLDNFWVAKGDLLFTRYNGSGHLVGVCGLYTANHRVLHPDKIIKLRTIDFDNDSCRSYLELCLNAGESRAFIKRNIKTTAGQQGIAGSDLKLTPIPLAAPEEQSEIVNIVEEKLSQIAALETWCATELTRSATLRQSILKDAFSGKLVPQDPADEPASDLLERIMAAKAAIKKPSVRAKSRVRSAHQE